MQVFDSVLELLGMLLKDMRILTLMGLLIVASVSDYRSYRIPNWLTAGGMAFGLIYNTIIPFSIKLGFFWALGGLAIGLLTMLPFYALGTLGAGDVKLMAMIGAFLGVSDVFNAVIFSLIAGGVAALGFALFNKVLIRMLGNVKDVAQTMLASTLSGIKPVAYMGSNESVGKLPYGVCISLGTLAAIAARQIGYV